MREVIITLILQGFDQKNHFFEGWPWLKFNDLRMALGTALKLYISVAKGLKLTVNSKECVIFLISFGMKVPTCSFEKKNKTSV